VSAIKVRFLKKFCEDDFPEKGMMAWLTDIEWNNVEGYYRLYFDFLEFEDENRKYFKDDYCENSIVKNNPEIPSKKFYTAIEAGYYNHKYVALFSISSNKRDDDVFEKEIQQYIREVVY